MASVYNRIRQLPDTNSGVAYANWGPATATPLGTATYPAGSVLWYYRSTSLGYAYAYDVQASNVLSTYSAATAAGGNFTADPTVACGAITSANAATFLFQPATLEAMIAVSIGKPCTFGQISNANGTSPGPNSIWNYSTLSAGTVANGIAQPAGTGTYFQTTASIRVAFTAPDTVTYYTCLIRTGDSAVWNCTASGSGTYAIQTLGDARVLTMTNPPALAGALTYNQIYVERGGKIYYGYQVKSGTSNSARLNLTATNALFTQLGMPVVVPQ